MSEELNIKYIVVDKKKFRVTSTDSEDYRYLGYIQENIEQNNTINSSEMSCVLIACLKNVNQLIESLQGKSIDSCDLKKLLIENVKSGSVIINMANVLINELMTVNTEK